MFKSTKHILAVAAVVVAAAPSAALADTTPAGSNQSQPQATQTNDVGGVLPRRSLAVDFDVHTTKASTVNSAQAK